MRTPRLVRTFAIACIALALSTSSALASYVPTPTASDGTYSSYVLVTWPSSSDARYGYFVYRSATKNFSSAVKLGRTTNRYWFDTKAGAARNYYYWVCPIYGRSGSCYYYYYNTSRYDDGNRYVYVPTPTVAKGKSSSSIYLSWTASPQAVYGYRIYRGTSSSFSYASCIGTTYNRYYYDSSAYPGRTYYYWVVPRCYNFNVYSSSKWGKGWKCLAVPTPSGYAYSRGINYLSWSSVYGAQKYRVYRGTSSSFSNARWIGTVTSPCSAYDVSATPGVGYYYWIAPVDCEGDAWYNGGRYKYIRTRY